MNVSELPPLAEVTDALRYAVAPAAVAAAGVALLGLLFNWILAQITGFRWRDGMPAIAVLSLAAAVAASPLAAVYYVEGDYQFRLPIPWVPDGRWWHWGWWAIGLALAVELLAQLPVTSHFAQLLRGLASGIIAAYVIPPEWREESKWSIPATAAVFAALWTLLIAVGRRIPGGGLAAGMSFVAFGAAAVLLHHKSLGFADVCIFISIGLAVIALLATVTRSDASPAAAVAVVPLLLLLLMGRGLVDTRVPQSSFLLVALAPLGYLIYLIPILDRLSYRRWGWVVALLIPVIPVIIAVGLAMNAEPMTFGEEEW